MPSSTRRDRVRALLSVLGCPHHDADKIISIPLFSFFYLHCVLVFTGVHLCRYQYQCCVGKLRIRFKFTKKCTCIQEEI
ncbi:hypothetical protein IW261DRAFT_1592146 [Armillaria novae-zelandiae]|uniref:Uncharacterized protein n=1 Tax=Armillaria novae-zelandiae TaxID=153914 RepID=A0AA39PDZ5_9AGAR|nr:hypothetical protein IW261DRAFT_1592146 [Armillaria novae-zelandiae]